MMMFVWKDEHQLKWCETWSLQGRPSLSQWCLSTNIEYRLVAATDRFNISVLAVSYCQFLTLFYSYSSFSSIVFSPQTSIRFILTAASTFVFNEIASCW
jgi:hypothetical protein